MMIKVDYMLSFIAALYQKNMFDLKKCLFHMKNACFLYEVHIEQFQETRNVNMHGVEYTLLHSCWENWKKACYQKFPWKRWKTCFWMNFQVVEKLEKIFSIFLGIFTVFDHIALNDEVYTQSKILCSHMWIALLISFFS